MSDTTAPPPPPATTSMTATQAAYGQLILPPSETRPHRLFRLDNHLEVILIHDPDCDKAAAAMDVGVGHLEDPASLPGCAHFCEHLMFLGTKKYPEENAYASYLAGHNGHSNAYTGLSDTNYYFDVAPDALEGALDRFAGFFVEPLFSEDCTEREIKAVDSEHKKNLQSDMWRFYQLEKHLSSPSHPYRKFGTGDFRTLWEEPKAADRDPRAELIEWWRQKYCARRMKLVVLGRDSLDTLEKWVRERFEDVPVRTKEGEERIVYNSEVVDEEHMGIIVFANPVKDMRILEITFPFPDQERNYQTKPGNYIAHFIGHEGPGSILSSLKRQGWVNKLSAGLSNGGIGFDFFKITVELTEEGLTHYNDVALVIFKYIHLLKSNPPQERAFHEIKSLADIAFRFVERGPPASHVSELTTWLQQPVPREKTISSQWLLEKWDDKIIQETLAHLDVRRSRMAVTAKHLPEGVGKLDKVEPIYGTEYRIQKMSPDFMRKAASGGISSDLSLPGPNAFIPEDLEVDKKEGIEVVQTPSLLRDNALSKLWHKKDDRFWVPRANLFVALKSPLLDVTPRNAAIGRLLCDLFRDAVTEKTYDAELAGLQFSIDYGGDHITIGTVGYNDKLAALTETMLRLFKGFRVDQERFTLIKDSIKRGWKNFALDEPYQLCAWYSHYIGSNRMWTPEDRLAEIDHIEAADVQAFATEFFNRLHLETLIHGNITREISLDIQDTIESVLAPRPLSAAELVGERSLLLPEGSEHIWTVKVPNPANVNSSVDYYCQVGDVADDQLRNTLALLAHLANEPCFNQLRTKEQLGYLVFSGNRSSTGQTGFRILVQSEKDAVYLETRIEAFLDHFKGYLEELAVDEFAQQRQSLVDKRLEKPKNLYGESSRFWSRIGDGYYDFTRRETDAATLKSLTKQQIIDLFTEKIHFSSPSRSKLSLHFQSQYSGVKFDTAQAMPLVQSFMAKNVAVSTEDLQQLLASSPSLSQVQDFARKCLLSATHLSEADRKELDHGVSALGVAAATNEPSGAVSLRDSNKQIEDIEAFKASLVPSRAAAPVRPYSVAA